MKGDVDQRWKYMLNNVVLVGRTVEDLTIVTLENGLKTCKLVLAVQRGFKNEDGNYDTDFIPITLWEGIAQATANNCKKGSVIGVKGRLQTRIIEIGDVKLKSIDLIGERVSFINLKKETQNKNE